MKRTNTFALRSKTLTQREVEVLGALFDGRGIREIGDLLAVSVTTVRNHVRHMLNVNSTIIGRATRTFRTTERCWR